MDQSTRVWVLGAADHEMEAIRQMLVDCRENITQALDRDGKPVTPATAYKACSVDRPELIGSETTLILFEKRFNSLLCNPNALMKTSSQPQG